MDLTREEINLHSLRHNIREIRKRIGRNVKICGVVKDNAYGHGILPVSKVLIKEGVEFLGLADVSDGIYLREKGIKVPIINLISNLPGQVKDIIRFNITQSVSELPMVKLINKESRKNNKIAKIHIKIDTGMGRLGVLPEDFKKFYKEVLNLKNIKIEGVYTHFASADKNKEYTLNQINIFKDLNSDIPANIIKHGAGSAAVINYKNSYFDMVRPGLMIYGLYYSKKDMLKINLKQVLAWKAKIILVKKMKKGSLISYGGVYRTKKDTKIAVVSVGYGDGFNRLLSNNGEVIIRGVKYPIVGRVCMDMTMIEIGMKSNVKIGDDVVLIGESKNEKIFVEDIAKKCKTISHEVVCGINAQIKRDYKKTK
ncbi:MAG: alanine racemase [Candidatus Firestonebacteria bacterium]